MASKTSTSAQERTKCKGGAALKLGKKVSRISLQSILCAFRVVDHFEWTGQLLHRSDRGGAPYSDADRRPYYRIHSGGGGSLERRARDPPHAANANRIRRRIFIWSRGYPQPTTGNWSASLTSESLLLVTVDAPSPWNFEIIDLNSANGITVGTSQFINGTFGETLNVEVRGAGCEGGWTGDLQIEELVAPESDQAVINRFFATFQLQCSGQSLSGCVSYGNN